MVVLIAPRGVERVLRARRSVPFIFSLLLAPVMPTLAAQPPSSGTILQQTQPAPALPETPGEVLKLPAPAEQGSASTVPIPVRELHIEGNRLLPTATLMAALQDVPGHTYTLGQLQKAVGRLTTLYHRRGYPLAYAYLPAQSIRAGIVKVAVVEPRYDRVEFSGHSRLKPAQAQRVLGVKAGEPIASAPLNRGLLLLNRTPGVRVAGTLVPGGAPASSTLQVGLSDTPRVRAGAQEDNDGGQYTGRRRTGVDVALDNPFGHGSRLAFNGLVTEGALLHSGGFNALSPDIKDGLRLSLYGSRTTYRLGSDFIALDQSGEATQLGAGASYPMVLQPGRLLEARLDLLRNTFEQKSGVVGNDSRSHIDLARLILSGAYADRTGGMTSGGISLGQGLLRLDSADARVSDALGARANGGFWVGQYHVQHRQPLAAGLVLQANLSGQLASGNLDGSQKFYLGGPDGVMSYPVGDAGGDEGVLLSLRLSHAIAGSAPSGRLRGALLLQAGEVRVNHTPYAGATAPNRQTRAGVGLGLDYRWQHHVHASITYAHKLGSEPTLSGPARDQQIWARLRLDS